MVQSLYGVQIFYITSTYVDLIHALFLEIYVPWTLRYLKKDEFMTLEQGGTCMPAYEAKFYTLSIYAMQLVNMEEEGILLFISSLSTKLFI